MVCEQGVVDLAGDEALQTADDVLLGQALGRPSPDIVEGRLVPAHADGHDAVECRVSLTVAATKEPMPMRHPARCRNRTCAAELREGRLGTHPRRVVTRDDHHLGSGVRTDAKRLTECRCGCVRDRVEDIVVCPDFRCQGEPTPSECPERVHRLLYATDGLAARAAYDAFLKKWTPLCPPVARSLEEAGLELLTFYTFPKAMWKSLRTTNALENLNREFRRRTKTQASFSTEAAALTVLFGLVAVGQIVFRKIDGHQDLAAFLRQEQWVSGRVTR